MSVETMREALKLADAALSGANMNMAVVRRKISEALAEQPAQGEAAACPYLKTRNGTTVCVLSGAEPPAPSVPKRLSAWAKHDSGDSGTDVQIGYESARRDVAAMLASAPPAPSVPDDVAKDAARYRWLRENDNASSIVHGYLHTGTSWLPRRSKLDAIIDAAMRAAAPARKS